MFYSQRFHISKKNIIRENTDRRTFVYNITNINILVVLETRES